MVEAEDIGKDNSVTVVYKDATVHPAKKGIYRLDATLGELRVYDGLAEVAAGDKNIEVKEGQQISLDTLATHRFDKNDTDALNRWSARRAEYDSMANVGAANSMRASLNGDGGNPFFGGWYWNSNFGMYSFVPGFGGMFYSPYGYPYFSPFDVNLAFMPGFFYYPGFGYGYGYGYYPGYGYGNGYGSGSGGASRVYNSVISKSVPVPVPSRPGGSVGAPGSGGSIASGRGPGGGVFGGVPSGSAGSVGSVGHASGGGVGGGGGGSHK